MRLTRREFTAALTGLTGAAALRSDRPLAAGEPDPCDLPPPVRRLEPMTAGVSPIANEERRARIDKAQRLMVEQGIARLLVEPGTSMVYYTGVGWSPSERTFALVIPARGELAWVCPGVRGGAGAGADPVRHGRARLAGGREPVPGHRRACSGTAASPPAGSAGGAVRFFIVDGLRKEAPALELVSATPVTAGCRMFKSPAEIALMQRASDITIAAFKAAFATLREGMTQYDLQATCCGAHAAWAATIPGRWWASASTPRFRTAACSRRSCRRATSCCSTPAARAGLPVGHHPHDGVRQADRSGSARSGSSSGGRRTRRSRRRRSARLRSGRRRRAQGDHRRRLRAGLQGAGTAAPHGSRHRPGRPRVDVLRARQHDDDRSRACASATSRRSPSTASSASGWRTACTSPRTGRSFFTAAEPGDRQPFG